MRKSIKDLSKEISCITDLSEDLVEAAIRSVRSGIDHAVAEQNISSTVKTLEGIAMPGLSNEGLITMAIASSSLYHKDAELVVESLQNYIIQNLNAGYELEIEGLGTYRKPSGIEELNRNSKLEFDPLPWPDIP